MRSIDCFQTVDKLNVNSLFLGLDVIIESTLLVAMRFFSTNKRTVKRSRTESYQLTVFSNRIAYKKVENALKYMKKELPK